MSSPRNVATVIMCVLVIVNSCMHAVAQIASTAQDPPSPRGRIPVETCRLEGPLVRIPSKTVGSDGLPVRISPPATARYPAGAPIAVQVAPGSVPAVDQARLCLKEQGFVDVGFHCPFSEARAASGGADRQQVCMEALADVLAFSTGRIQSLENKSIHEYVGPVKALTTNVGMIAWSAGGNLATLTMARHGDRFPDLAWYASWESPVLSSVDGGWGSVFQANPFYDPRTGRVDFARLRYSSEMPLWVWPPQGLQREPGWPLGGLYLDGDNNNIFSRESDYGFWVSYNPLNEGEPRKSFYTPTVTREARDRKVFGAVWPAHIATVEEVERRADIEDVMRRIPSAVQRLPALAIIVFESLRGHVTNSADHPHAIAQVNAWLDGGARWVRLNPDLHYVEVAMGKRPSREVQNPAGRKLDRASIGDLVEAEADAGGPTDAQGMAAAACELADRTYTKTWAPVLNQVLIPIERRMPG